MVKHDNTVNAINFYNFLVTIYSDFFESFQVTLTNPKNIVLYRRRKTFHLIM